LTRAACPALRSPRDFFTSLCAFDPAAGTAAADVVATEVVYRQLREVGLARYLARAPAHGGSDSARAESLGILLFAAINGFSPPAAETQPP